MRGEFLGTFLLFFLIQGSDNRVLEKLKAENVERAVVSGIMSDQENDVLDCYSVQFYLATRQDPQGSTKACLEQSAKLFNGSLTVTKPTRIVVHGWRNNRLTPFTQQTTKAYLEVEDVNVIQVDWGKDAELDYLTAAYRVPEVGYTLAKFIQRLVDELNLDVNEVQLIGFSLGAHVVGIAGYYTTPKVPLAIGLDPAGPLFELVGPTGKLSLQSGRFVVTLHACKFRLGTGENLGHLNFNANSGMSQPGCWNFNGDHDLLGFCSHNRAFEYFVESMIHPQGFPSTKCNTYFEYELGMCKNEPKTYFRANFNESLTGTFYFVTTSQAPYIKSENSTNDPFFDFKDHRETPKHVDLDDFGPGMSPKDAEGRARLRDFSKNLNEMLSLEELPPAVKEYALSRNSLLDTSLNGR